MSLRVASSFQFFLLLQVRTNLKDERSWSAQLGKTSSWKHKAPTDRVWMTMPHDTHRECRWCRREIHEYALMIWDSETQRENITSRTRWKLLGSTKTLLLGGCSIDGTCALWTDLVSTESDFYLTPRPDQYKVPELPILVLPILSTCARAHGYNAENIPKLPKCSILMRMTSRQSLFPHSYGTNQTLTHRWLVVSNWCSTLDSQWNWYWLARDENFKSKNLFSGTSPPGLLIAGSCGHLRDRGLLEIKKIKPT